MLSLQQQGCWCIGYRAIIALAFVLVAMLAVAAPQPLVIANPGFEGNYAQVSECANITGEVAGGWSDNTCWDTTQPVINYARDSANPHGGATAQKITLVRGSRVQFAQFLGTPFQTGTLYTVSLWMRAQTPTAVTVSLRQAPAPFTGYFSSLVTVPTAWTRFTFQGVTDSAEGVLLIIAETPGSVWVDDVETQAATAPDTSSAPPSSPVPRSYFGMHFNRLDTPWPQIGAAIGSVRIWDAGANANGSGAGSQWSEINPAPGSYDWRGLDARVTAALANGAEIIYTLGGRTPQWAAARPAAPSPYGDGQCSEPANNQIWQDWVRAIATRYRGKIKQWEIWNEPDIVDFYCGTPTKLVDLARLAHAVIKQVDPANQVLSPGMSGGAGPGYLDTYFALGGGAYADIVSYHFYANLPEQNIGARTANIKLVVLRHGQQLKPLWNTEQGWIESPTPTPIPEALGAAYVARAYLINWAQGLSRYCYYTWDNQWNQFAFTQAGGVTLTESGRAYREVAQWMTGKVMDSLNIDASANYVATLLDASGTKSWAVWNPNQTQTFAIPVTWNAVRQHDLSGAVVELNSSTSVSIGTSPLLLEQAAISPPHSPSRFRILN